MKKALIGLILVVVLLAVLAAALFIYPSRKFRAALDEGLARLAANETVKVESAGYQTASYSLLGGKASIRGLTVKFKDNLDTPLEYYLETLEGTGVPLKVAVALLRGEAGLFEKGFKAFDQLKCGNLSLKMSDDISPFHYQQRASIIKGLRVRPSEGPPEFKNAPGPFLDWLFSNITYESSQNLGIEMTIVSSEPSRGKMVLQIAEYGSENYDQFKLGRLNAEDISLLAMIAEENLQFKLGGLNADNLHFERLLKLIALALNDAERAQAEMQSSNIFMPYYGYDQATMGPLEVLWKGKSIVQVESISSAHSMTPGEFPPQASSAIKGLVINVRQIPVKPGAFQEEDMIVGRGMDTAVKALLDMGYEQIKADLAAELAYSKENKTLELKRYTFDVADAFKLDLSFKLSSLDLGDTQTNLTAVTIGLLHTALDNVQISFADQGLAERLTTYAANKITGQNDPAAFTEMLTNGLDLAAPALGATLENPVPVINELKAFISQPGSLSLQSGHTTPVPLVSLANLDARGLVEAFKPNLTVNNRAPLELSPASLDGDEPVPSSLYDLDDDDDDD